MKIIFVRHGESKSNEGNLFTGQTNVPLSSVGREQAERLKAYILTHFSVQKVYSSDLQRAYDTVLPIAEALGISVQTKQSLREIDGGEWEEKTVDYLLANYAEDYNHWLSDIGNAGCTGGESMAQVQARAVGAIAQIASGKEDCVLVGTHAGFLRAMECVWRGVPLSEMKRIPWQVNTAVSVVDYDENGFCVECIGKADHVGELVTKLPEKM